MAIHSSSIRPAVWQSLVNGSRRLLVIGAPESELSERARIDDRVKLLCQLIGSWDQDIEQAALVMFLPDSVAADRNRVVQVCSLKGVQCIKVTQSPEDIDALVAQLPQPGAAHDPADDSSDVEDDVDEAGDDTTGGEVDSGSSTDVSPGTPTAAAIEQTLDQLLGLYGQLDGQVKAILAERTRAPELEAALAALRGENTRLADENASLRQQVQRLAERIEGLQRLSREAARLLNDTEAES